MKDFRQSLLWIMTSLMFLSLLISFTPMNSTARAEAATPPKSAAIEKPLSFVLVHGAWVDAGFWKETAAELRLMGHEVYTPEYAGHGGVSSTQLGSVTHEQMTRSVVEYMNRKKLKDVVLLGHSFGGSIVQKTAEQLPDRIRRLVFFDAFVPLDGQSVADQFAAPVRESFEQLRKSSGNNTISLPFPLFREAFVNTATLAEAQAYYTYVIPEPAGPAFQKLDLKKFYSLDIPKSYLFLTEDTALPQTPFGYHPSQSAHLGAYRYIAGHGDHMTTAHKEPKRLAELIVQASRD